MGREWHQLLVLLGERGARRALPVRRRGSRAAPRADAADGLQLARLPAGRRARAALRPACPRAVGARARAALQPGQAPARSLCEGDRRRRALGGREHTALPPWRARSRGRGGRLRRRGRDAALRRGRHGVRLGGRPATRDSLGRDRHLRAAREGLHQAAPRRARGPARHLCGPRLRWGDRVPEVARRHCGGIAPGAPHRGGALHPRARAHELLGLLVDRLPRAARRLCGHRGAGRAGRRVQGHGQGAAPRRHRGHPRRGLQPHGRGQPPRADALLQGHRQRLVLPADAGRPVAIHGLHRHGQQPQPGASQRAPPDHGLAALLGHRLPRRRLPLRSGLGAGARAVRRRPALRLLRRDPPGPNPVAGQADRRALGSRPGRVPGRQLPGALDRVERPLPRHDARRLARSGQRGRLRLALHRARAISTSPTGAIRRPRSTS